MTKILPLALGALLLAGCSFSNQKTLYEVRLMSGHTLYAESKPALRDNQYTFDDVNDQHYALSKDDVLFIEAKKFSR